MPSGRRRRLSVAAGVVGALVGVAVIVGCGADRPAPSGEQRFCAELSGAETELTADAVSDPAAAAAVADRFAQLGELAPADIRDEWGALTGLFRTVGGLDPADPGFRAAVLSEVGRTVTAAAEVTSWVQQRCGLDLTAGSLAAATTPPATATTLPAAATATTTTVPTAATATTAPAGTTETTVGSGVPSDVGSTVPLTPVTG